ncbi:aldehyde dehydrogenase (NAD+) [Rhodothalassium salexigens DSM 2132]|uniref:Aldehyde dehydrogenase (NAD+) n=1 Tax=Rhodothalassium salexigens DSM 2132 TaxID=1188247 RepID=A0A4R2PCT3_RHOSA|nr:aldehyde dehydrogenase family protein [Rhodothalassium salexigens]MBB4212126.1 aldehyde dehydrogenase (NAD+) [Rhodothalassium salexigens DSM 2132]MBK1640126.1 hypothetical protein [Rhodothalassium salexigens DSM 2132]TCP33000.1 aldehyde dehydrogenase (NAD+) [Rhodothalassium salexigens DSM 2132]
MTDTHSETAPDYAPVHESAEAVRRWLAERPSFALFIDGRWQASHDALPAIASTNPATGDLLAHIAQAGPQDVDAAVAAARRAQPAWAALSGADRARHLHRLARLVHKHARTLAVLETLDNGKPIRETRHIDIPGAVRHLTYHANQAALVAQTFPDHAPHGVAGQVIPWNFPLLMASWKIAPALACGNTVVLKPAEYTSLTALYLADLVAEAGLPAGTVNIVTGAGDTGAALVAHPGVDKVAFTGSTEVGRAIRRATAGSGKALTLELGGKSPFIVCADADLDAAVEGLMSAIWFNQGEVCCAGSRLLVEEAVAEPLVAKIKARLARLRLGDPLDRTTDMGALVDRVQHERVAGLVARAVEEGAAPWQPDIDCPATGCFHRPTVLTDVAPANVAAREEIFGPVLSVLTFRTDAEAADMANNTRYGLAGSVWSETGGRALALARRIKAGVVWVNCTNKLDAGVPFGGVRQSGFGREGGREGLLAYLKRRDRQQTPDTDAETATLDTDAVPAGVADAVHKAVEAAAKAAPWAQCDGRTRAAALVRLAQAVDDRRDALVDRLVETTGADRAAARHEVETSAARLYAYAGHAESHEGGASLAQPGQTVLTLAEPVGVLGIVCPDRPPLVALVSLLAPALAMGNRAVLVAGPGHAALADDLQALLAAAQLPQGVATLLTGARGPLARALAEHGQVDGVWCFTSAADAAAVEAAAADDLKRTWVSRGRSPDWLSPPAGDGAAFLDAATATKTLWLPHDA